VRGAADWLFKVIGAAHAVLGSAVERRKLDLDLQAEAARPTAGAWAAAYGPQAPRHGPRARCGRPVRCRPPGAGVATVDAAGWVHTVDWRCLHSLPGAGGKGGPCSCQAHAETMLTAAQTGGARAGFWSWPERRPPAGRPDAGEFPRAYRGYPAARGGARAGRSSYARWQEAYGSAGGSDESDGDEFFGHHYGRFY